MAIGQLVHNVENAGTGYLGLFHSASVGLVSTVLSDRF